MLLAPLVVCALTVPAPGRPGAQAVRAAPAPVVRLTPWQPLGAAAGGKLRAALLYRVTDQDGIEGVLSLRGALDPAAPAPATPRVHDVPIGRGWRTTACLRACRFGLGVRYQVAVTFLEISGEQRAVRLAVFDFDGQRFRMLYSRSGLKGALADHVRGSWRIAEDWEIGSYRSVRGRGTAEDLGNGTARRWLYWNGRAFVPDVPGPTRVVHVRPTGLPSVYRYTPQRSVTFVRSGRGGSPRVRIGGFTTRENAEFGREAAVDPTGRFLYVSAGASSHVSQFRIGWRGVLTPLAPARVYAPSHPGSITFHPDKRIAYVSCSHGAICQFRILPTGQLEPLQPAVVYGESTPSELRFSRWGLYALVVAARREILPSGEAGDVGDDDAGYLYKVADDGTLTFVRQVPGRGYGYQAASVTVRWSGRGRPARRLPVRRAAPRRAAARATPGPQAPRRGTAR